MLPVKGSFGSIEAGTVAKNGKNISNCVLQRNTRYFPNICQTARYKYLE